MVTLNGSAPDLLGLSTDEKPDDAFENSLFLELDTGDFYYFSDGKWAKVGEASNAKSALNSALKTDLRNEKESPLPFEDEESFEEVEEDGETRK